ncbi:MAG: hypothetical protein PHU12_04485 [Candidatus Aenigmarchaeota archaeon]|nr:hypothetical protein [Candidatus Aenigmarchaeota archaeon]
MFEKLRNKKFNWYDNLELNAYSERIKKICKKYEIEPKSKEMYLRIQKDIFRRSSISTESIETKEKALSLLHGFILLKVNTLNKEFIDTIRLNFQNSAKGLARQIVETYIRLLYCRINKEYITHLLGKYPQESKNYNSIKKLIEELKDSDINISYIQGINKNEMLDSFYSAYGYLSDTFHMSIASVAPAIWSLKNKGNKTYSSELYANNQDGDSIAIVPSAFPDEIKKWIQLFFTYSGFIYEELNLK